MHAYRWELVQDARQAGISVGKKGMQLWQVGAGLPLDAIKKGSITSWKCQYEISDQEITSLVDALGKNESRTLTLTPNPNPNPSPGKNKSLTLTLTPNPNPNPSPGKNKSLTHLDLSLA